jgi:hypothetical protein
LLEQVVVVSCAWERQLKCPPLIEL